MNFFSSEADGAGPFFSIPPSFQAIVRGFSLTILSRPLLPLLVFFSVFSLLEIC